MNTLMKKRTLTIVLVICLLISHLFTSILVINAAGNETVNNEYALEAEAVPSDYRFVRYEYPSASLDGATLALPTNEVTVTAIVESSSENCYVIAEGQFANQAGVNGIAGAQWLLCDNGVLEVSEGFINWEGWQSPWHNFRSQITEIMFTGPITAGVSLQGLFTMLENVIGITGLEFFDTSSVINLSGMFSHMTSLTSLDLSSWDTHQVTDMSEMFFRASNLVTLNVLGWDTSQVNNMSGMIDSASSLVALDVSSWDTHQVTDMRWMFTNTSSLTDLDVSHWNTHQVTNMVGMFAGASSLTELNLSNWNVSQVTDMRWMFNTMRDLTTLDLSGWHIDQGRYMSWMFGNTTSLRQFTLPEGFSNADDLDLPSVPQDEEFTGYWQNVGNGTIANPQGEFIFTSAQLLSQGNPPEDDTWVWQPANQLSLRDILRQLIAEADARVQANYTPRSWANMMSRLTFARSVYNNPAASDAQISEAITLLRSELDALIER